MLNDQHKIIEIIGERQLRWFGHLKRLESDRNPKMIFEFNAEGTREKGKPRKHWMDRVRINKIIKDQDAKFIK